MTLYFKVLGKDRMPCRGGKGRYPDIGEWTKPVEVNPCKSGYHLCRPRDLLGWIKFDGELYLAEGAGSSSTCNNKVVFERVRLVQKLPLTTKLAQEFAYSCALHVLPIFENQFPDDKRVRECLEVTRNFLDGKASEEELEESRRADWDARNAWAAEAAARAARNAWTARNAWAAEAAARAARAAWDAWDARAAEAARAAWDARAARAAEAAEAEKERQWQTGKLMSLLGLKLEGWVE